MLRESVSLKESFLILPASVFSKSSRRKWNVIIGSCSVISLHFECNWEETWLGCDCDCHSNWQSIKNIFIRLFFYCWFLSSICSAFAVVWLSLSLLTIFAVCSHRFCNGMRRRAGGGWRTCRKIGWRHLNMSWREAEDADDCVCSAKWSELSWGVAEKGERTHTLDSGFSLLSMFNRDGMFVDFQCTCATFSNRKGESNTFKIIFNELKSPHTMISLSMEISLYMKFWATVVHTCRRCI